MWETESKFRGTRDGEAPRKIEDWCQWGIKKRERRWGRVKDQSVVCAEFLFVLLVLRLPVQAKHDEITTFLVDYYAYSLQLLIQVHIQLLPPSNFRVLYFFAFSSR